MIPRPGLKVWAVVLDDDVGVTTHGVVASFAEVAAIVAGWEAEAADEAAAP